MYKLTIHTDKGTFEINIDKLQELDTILINYDGYDYIRATNMEDNDDNKKLDEGRHSILQKRKHQ